MACNFLAILIKLVQKIVITLDLIPDFLACVVKFMFSKKATKIDQIFTIDLTLTK